jgi:hypothetical protein
MVSLHIKAFASGIEDVRSSELFFNCGVEREGYAAFSAGPFQVNLAVFCNPDARGGARLIALRAKETQFHVIAIG